MGNDTKRLIKESLIGLLNDKPFDGICIKELTDACGISRNTFYYHYHDIYEVLEEIFDEHTKQHIGEADTWELWEDGILSSLEFVLQNRKAVYHVYNSLNRENLERYINRVMSPITLRFVKQQAQGALARFAHVQHALHGVAPLRHRTVGAQLAQTQAKGHIVHQVHVGHEGPQLLGRGRAQRAEAP